MKIQEIDQRADNEVIVRCSCGSYHLVSFRYRIFKEDKVFSVELYDENEGLWQRIKDAFNHIFKNERIIFSEINLTTKDLEKIKVLMDEYIKSDSNLPEIVRD